MSLKFLPLVWKHIIRRPARSALTMLGVAAAMALFCAVGAMREGVRDATESNARETTLVVYRENRYCPFTSQLPEDYGRQIAALPGVASVVPIQIVVSNCRASLDVVTYRGVPPDDFEASLLQKMRLLSGSMSEWKRRGDAALVGERLAERRGLKVGDPLSVGGIAVTVAGIVASEEAQDQNVAYTHLEFIQRAAGQSDGVVTQFNVTVNDPARLDEVASAIDEHFHDAREPTATWSEKAFAARAMTDILEIANFAAWLGWGALAAVFALVANSIALSVQERVRDCAVFQTLGFTEGLVARLIVAEGALIGLAGGSLGLAITFAGLRWSALSFSVEGLSVNIEANLGTVALGLALCAALGALASLWPAIRASRLEIAACFRAV
jgi:putative ABC transport system permease protein